MWTSVPRPGAAWCEAVAAIAAKAHDKLPECNGRVDSAVKIVLAGDVELLPDGTARVASQSNGATQYVVCNGSCDCMDFAKAPHNFCKHRRSAAIARRAQEVVKAKLAQLDGASNGQATPASHEAPAGDAQVWRSNTPPAPLPEAPASVNCYITLTGRQVQVTLRDTDEVCLLARLETLLQRFPVTESIPPAGTATPMTQPTPEGWCVVHGVQMKQQHNQRGSWYSHKLADGTWCKGKGQGR